MTTGNQVDNEHIAARRLFVHGLVQGVGFRPFVWRLAARWGLRGSVRNAGGVVEIVVEGDEHDLAAFCRALVEEAPIGARVDKVEWTAVPATGRPSFIVDASSPDGARGWVPVDVATCPECLAEVNEPTARRFRYAFATCATCGPRFTILERVPYDRAHTSMRHFPLCVECATEYHDPVDRRFHAEAIACPACGPRLAFFDGQWNPVEGDVISRAAHLLTEGAVIGVEGLGGFHLACDATNETAVATLRARKQRPAKPFAVMVADLAMAHQFFTISDAQGALLTSPQAPIVLVRDRGVLAPSVAPRSREHGVMLPSTPLHHLLVRSAGRPLVMTSGNRADEPICASVDEARDRLTGIADAFVVHDRLIVTRVDDSVTRWRRGGVAVLRRARGYAPTPISLGASVPPVLGCGAQLHTALCLASGREAFVSQHLGDLDTEEAFTVYVRGFEHLRDLLGIEPELVAHDLHPDFMTTRFAQTLGMPTVAVQHHHAHVAAVMAEHALTGAVIGVAFDGFGLGDDGTAWGGEFLICDGGRYRRAGHLRPVRQPGGDAAVREPARMAYAWALDAGCEDDARRLLESGLTDAQAGVIEAQVRSGVASPWTSSVGRVFDAVAALTGVCRTPSYDGEAPVGLEQIADLAQTEPYPFRIVTREDRFVVDLRPLAQAVVQAAITARPAAEISGRFHRTMGAVVEQMCCRLRDQTGLSRVCLAGGVFANEVLFEDVVSRLETEGFTVYFPRQVPPGDGGLALGQIFAAAQLQAPSCA